MSRKEPLPRKPVDLDATRNRKRTGHTAFAVAFALKKKDAKALNLLPGV